MIYNHDIKPMGTPMRTLVDIPTDLLQSLDDISRQADVSRAEVIRRALREYIVTHQQVPDVFGLIKSLPDGLEAQRSLRDEW